MSTWYCVRFFWHRTSRSCSWVQNPTVSYLLRRMKLNLWTLQHHDRFLSESRNRREKSNYQTRGRNRSKKEQKGSKGGVDIYYFWGRAGNMPAFDDETFGDEAFGDENFRWRSFRWWNFRWRGVRWSVRKKCWVFAGPIRLLNFFEECCWCQTDLRDHFLYKHLHRFRLASELWVCLLVLHVQF